MSEKKQESNPSTNLKEDSQIGAVAWPWKEAAPRLYVQGLDMGSQWLWQIAPAGDRQEFRKDFRTGMLQGLTPSGHEKTKTLSGGESGCCEHGCVQRKRWFFFSIKIVQCGQNWFKNLYGWREGLVWKSPWDICPCLLTLLFLFCLGSFSPKHTHHLEGSKNSKVHSLGNTDQ